MVTRQGSRSGEGTEGRTGGPSGRGAGKEVETSREGAQERAPVQGDALMMMEVFAAQIQNLEARLMANVTAQLESFRS